MYSNYQNPCQRKILLKNKLLLLSSLIICSIIAFLYWSTLSEQTQLPSQTWSRSFPVDNVEGSFFNLKAVPEEDGYTISLLDFKNLFVLSCNKDLECKENRTIDSLTTSKNSWNNKTESYYIKDNSLMHANASGETEIASNVTNFSKSEDTIIYWTDDQVLTVLKSPFSSEKQQLKMNEPIIYVKILEDQTFIVTEDKNNDRYILYNLSKGFSPLLQFKLASTEILSSLHIVEQKDKSYSLLVNKKIGSSGASTTNMELTNFDLSLNQTPTFDKLSFVEKETGIRLKNIQFPSVSQGEHGTVITFSSTFLDVTGEKVTKIFIGNLSNNSVQADPLTKSGTRYERSVFLNDQTVAYLKMKGSVRYLEYSSSDEAKQLESKKIMEGDYKAAGYLLLSKSFNGFILLLFSFVWLIIAFIITYGLLFLLQKGKLIHSYTTAFIIHLIALFSIQTYFIYRFVSLDSIIYNIPYITENWQFPIILIVSAILSVIPLFILRFKLIEDNFNLFVLYTSFMNLIILFFLIGPYMF